MRREISWLKPSHTARLYRGAHGNRRAAPREKPLDRRPLPPLSNERTASPLDERGTPAHVCRGVSGKAREVAISPLVRTFPDGEEVHRFFFRVIKLWEVPAELLLQTGWPGVLPLVTLTDGGKRPEVVKAMIDRLALAEEYDLLAISQVIGGLVFKKGPELEWFRKRFSMFQDILRESWVYQEIIEQ